MLKYLFKNKQKPCLHRPHPPSTAHFTRSDVNLSCFILLFWPSCLLSTDNIPCVLSVSSTFHSECIQHPHVNSQVSIRTWKLLIFTQDHQVSLDHHQILFLCWSTCAHRFLHMMMLRNLLLKLFEENSNVHSSLGVQNADLGEQRREVN